MKCPPEPDPDLSVFYDPQSVAVVGASDNTAKWGYWLAAGALEGSSRRGVHFVNPTGRDILGVSCHRALDDLPEAPELVALCVPPSQIAGVVDRGRAMGVRGYVCITAGVPSEAELVERVRSGGARFIGANSLGIYNAATQLRLAWGPFMPGPLAIITQSGQVGSELAIQCAQQGIGVSRLVSVGNQTDVRARELLDDLATDDATHAVALYLESFADGTALFETLRDLRSAGKPTLLLTVGASPASSRLARSHTGSLTSPTHAVDAACRASGVLHVQTPHQLATVARAVLSHGATCGRSIAIVGDSGGQCGIAADLAHSTGMLMPDLAEPTKTALRQHLPPEAGLSNPVDLAGAGEADLFNYADVVDAAMSDESVQAVVLTGYFGRYGTETPELATAERRIARLLAEASRRHDKSLVVHTMDSASATAEMLWQHGIPALGSIEDAMLVTRGLAHLATPATPRPGRGPGGQATPLPGGYWAARHVLQDTGVSLPPARLVRTTRELRAAASQLTKPLVLKAGWLDHKSDAGGVALGLTGQHAALSALRSMRNRLGNGEYVLEEQDVRSDCVEMLVGARRDAALGPLVLVGRGGTETEIWQDIAIECAPIGLDDAHDMIERLTCAPLLSGWRGHQPVDREALARLVVSISDLITARADVAEVELNPVRVGPGGALAVDALLVNRAGHQDISA